MGYTHYWKFKQNPKDIKNGADKFKKAVNMLKVGLTKSPKKVDFKYYDYKNNTIKDVDVDLVLAGGNGTGEPVFDDECVCFNGLFTPETDFSHETCCIQLDEPDNFEFDFCKTNEKPYDVAVCLTLLCFKDSFGDDFTYSSDGDGTKYGWVTAKKIFNSIF